MEGRGEWEEVPAVGTLCGSGPWSSVSQMCTHQNPKISNMSSHMSRLPPPPPPFFPLQGTTPDDIQHGPDAKRQREIYQAGMVQARHRRMRRCGGRGAGEGRGGLPGRHGAGLAPTYAQVCGGGRWGEICQAGVVQARHRLMRRCGTGGGGRFRVVLALYRCLP